MADRNAIIAEQAADDAAETVFQWTRNSGLPVVLSGEDRERIAAVVRAALDVCGVPGA